MASKYTSVVNRLPKFQPVNESTTQEELIGKLTKELKVLGFEDKLAMFCELREERDRLEDERKAVDAKIEALTRLIIDSYEERGVQSVKLDSGASVSMQVEPYAQVVDRDAFREWCIKNGLANALQLPWQSTSSLTKERLLAGDPEPDGVQAFCKSKLVLRRG